MATAGLGCEFITGPLPEADDALPSGTVSTTTVDATTSSDVSGDGSTAAVGGESSTGSSSGSSSMGSTGTTDFDRAGGCCEPHRAPGCDDDDVAACVCDADPFCCDVSWDASCVELAALSGCGRCEVPPQPANEGACCEEAAEGGVGCEDRDVAACVCAEDPFCCEQEWDVLCADAVDTLECGTCEDRYGGPSCCFVQPGASCESDAVAACVCEFDAFCCEVQWDGQCVAEVEKLGCGPCEGTEIGETGQETTGYGSSSSSSGSSTGGVGDSDVTATAP
ncbi:MAG: hypothetical protein AAGA54_29970 [Myxococcota bacterium]